MTIAFHYTIQARSIVFECGEMGLIQKILRTFNHNFSFTIHFLPFTDSLHIFYILIKMWLGWQLMLIHLCIHVHVCKLLRKEAGGGSLPCHPPTPMLRTCRLPIINAVAGDEVRGSRRAPLIHVHCIIQRSENAKQT